LSRIKPGRQQELKASISLPKESVLMHPIQRLRYARQAGIDTFSASTIKRVTVVITTAITKEIQGVTSNRSNPTSTIDPNTARAI
jgi:hypothetical protein